MRSTAVEKKVRRLKLTPADQAQDFILGRMKGVSDTQAATDGSARQLYEDTLELAKAKFGPGRVKEAGPTRKGLSVPDVGSHIHYGIVRSTYDLERRGMRYLLSENVRGGLGGTWTIFSCCIAPSTPAAECRCVPTEAMKFFSQYLTEGV